MGEIHGGPTVNDEMLYCPQHPAWGMWIKHLEGGQERYCPACVFDQLAEFRKANASWARCGADTVKQLQQLQERDRISAVTGEKLSRALSREHQELVNARQRLADHESRVSGYTGSAKPLYGYEEGDYRDQAEKAEETDRAPGENETDYRERKHATAFWIDRALKTAAVRKAKEAKLAGLDHRAAIQQEYFRETFAHQLGLYLEWLEKRMSENKSREQA